MLVLHTSEQQSKRSFSASIFRAFSRPNPILGFIVIVIFLTLGLTLFWPPASTLFGFGHLHVHSLIVVAITAILVLLTLEGNKYVAMRKGLKMMI